MTDPGERGAVLREFPADIAEACSIISTLLIHTEWLDAYGVAERHFSELSRRTLPIAERLGAIFAADGRSLLTPRDPQARSGATCRDYAVMLCSVLRSQGHDARVRCGFASYLEPNRWEDHWVCERRISGNGSWVLTDAQIDGVLRNELRLPKNFDHMNLSPSDFMTAGEAWKKCRAGSADPSHFGHGETTGLWFIHVNVVRDHLALNNREISAWDSWRLAGPSQRLIADASFNRLDRLAESPARALRHLQEPPWTLS